MEGKKRKSVNRLQTQRADSNSNLLPNEKISFQHSLQSFHHFDKSHVIGESISSRNFREKDPQLDLGRKQRLQDFSNTNTQISSSNFFKTSLEKQGQSGTSKIMSPKQRLAKEFDLERQRASQQGLSHEHSRNLNTHNKFSLLEDTSRMLDHIQQVGQPENKTLILKGVQQHHSSMMIPAQLKVELDHNRSTQEKFNLNFSKDLMKLTDADFTSHLSPILLKENAEKLQTLRDPKHFNNIYMKMQQMNQGDNNFFQKDIKPQFLNQKLTSNAEVAGIINNLNFQHQINFSINGLQKLKLKTNRSTHVSQQSHLDSIKPGHLNPIKDHNLHNQTNNLNTFRINHNTNGGFIQGRQMAIDLVNWYNKQIETVKFDKENSTYQMIDKLNQIYEATMLEILRQVSLDCKERGQLLGQIWDSNQELVKCVLTQQKTQFDQSEKTDLKSITWLNKRLNQQKDISLLRENKIREQIVEVQNAYQQLETESKYLRQKLKRVTIDLGQQERFITTSTWDYKQLDSVFLEVYQALNEFNSQQSRINNLDNAKAPAPNGPASGLPFSNLTYHVDSLENFVNQVSSILAQQRPTLPMEKLESKLKDTEKYVQAKIPDFKADKILDNELFVKDLQDQSIDQIKGVEQKGTNTNFLQDFTNEKQTQTDPIQTKSNIQTPQMNMNDRDTIVPFANPSPIINDLLSQENLLNINSHFKENQNEGNIHSRKRGFPLPPSYSNLDSPHTPRIPTLLSPSSQSGTGPHGGIIKLQRGSDQYNNTDQSIGPKSFADIEDFGLPNQHIEQKTPKIVNFIVDQGQAKGDEEEKDIVADCFNLIDTKLSHSLSDFQNFLQNIQSKVNPDQFDMITQSLQQIGNFKKGIQQQLTQIEQEIVDQKILIANQQIELKHLKQINKNLSLKTQNFQVMIYDEPIVYSPQKQQGKENAKKIASKYMQTFSHLIQESIQSSLDEISPKELDFDNYDTLEEDDDDEEQKQFSEQSQEESEYDELGDPEEKKQQLKIQEKMKNFKNIQTVEQQKSSSILFVKDASKKDGTHQNEQSEIVFQADNTNNKSSQMLITEILNNEKKKSQPTTTLSNVPKPPLQQQINNDLNDNSQSATIDKKSLQKQGSKKSLSSIKEQPNSMNSIQASSNSNHPSTNNFSESLISNLILGKSFAIPQQYGAVRTSVKPFNFSSSLQLENQQELKKQIAQNRILNDVEHIIRRLQLKHSQKTKVSSSSSKSHKNSANLIKIFSSLLQQYIKDIKKGLEIESPQIVLHQLFLKQFGFQNIAENKFYLLLQQLLDNRDNEKLMLFAKVLNLTNDNKQINNINQFASSNGVVPSYFKNSKFLYDKQNCSDKDAEVLIQTIIYLGDIQESATVNFDQLNSSKQQISECIQLLFNNIAIPENEVKNMIVNLQRIYQKNNNFNEILFLVLDYYTLINEKIEQKYLNIVRFTIDQEQNQLNYYRIQILIENIYFGDFNKRMRLLHVFREARISIENEFFIEINDFYQLSQKNNAFMPTVVDEFILSSWQQDLYFTKKYQHFDDIIQNFRDTFRIIQVRFIKSGVYYYIHQFLMENLNSENQIQQQGQFFRQLIFSLAISESNRMIIEKNVKNIITKELYCFINLEK